MERRVGPGLSGFPHGECHAGFGQATQTCSVRFLLGPVSGSHTRRERPGVCSPAHSRAEYTEEKLREWQWVRSLGTVGQDTTAEQVEGGRGALPTRPPEKPGMLTSPGLRLPRVAGQGSVDEATR